MRFDFALGLVLIAFGLFTLWMRLTAPQSRMFSKLEPMQKALGSGLGTALHWVSYTVLPIVVGALMLIYGL